MQKSVAKTITLLIIACIIIMGIVIFYHYKNQREPIRLASDHALIFAAAREIKPFTLATINNQKFSERDFYQHWTLLFFGFTHCMSVCPTTLTMLKEAYPDLHKAFPNLQVVLVTLDPARDNAEVTTQYAKHFHPDFYGVSGKITDVRKLQGQLGIASEKDETIGNNYQINHTPSIMLISPKGNWVAIFKNDMRTNEFKQVFKDSVQEIERLKL